MNTPIKFIKPRRCSTSRPFALACACFVFLLCITAVAQTSEPPASTTTATPLAANLEQTKAAIAHMRTPIRSVPLSVVVESLTGHKVLPFDFENPNHAEVLERMNRAAAAVVAKIKTEGGINSKRVNEVGNTIEKYVRDALDAEGLQSAVPTGAKSGKARVVGYPDITFTFNGERFYMECKTYSAATADTTMRTFYLSPSDDPKIACDAVHLIISFETSRAGDIYQLVHYKLISLEQLALDVKYEFNSNNRRMYSGNDGAVTIADVACD